MLLKDLVATLVGVGLDPYLGFYHQPRYGRPALALDLMEEFRPLVADSVVINLINNGEVRPTDFITRAGACALTPHGRKQVLEGYERRLDMLVIHPHFGYAISYRRIFEVQARLLARLLTEEINFYPAFCTR
jgi:CRISPR-associated protein Cas1